MKDIGAHLRSPRFLQPLLQEQCIRRWRAILYNVLQVRTVK